MNKNFFSTAIYLSPWLDTYPANGKQVVTCFIQKENQILVLQRGRKDAQYQLWGIPGGKKESQETVLQALSRELKEEIDVSLDEDQFMYLGSAISKTLTDGTYGLHLYHAKYPDNAPDPVINHSEHLNYRWVTIEEFQHMQLLHAQKEAFLYVKKELMKIISQDHSTCLS